MDPAATRPRILRTRLKAWILVAFLALVCVLPDAFLPPAAHGAESTTAFPSLKKLDSGQPWQIEADRISYDQLHDEYIAEGQVRVWKQDRSISADTVRYNLQTKMAYAEGHVVLTAGSDILTGDYLETDMESEQGYITNGTIFIAKSNYHIQGDRIQKTGPETYTIAQGVVTTCDGRSPDWKIAGRDVTVQKDGSGTAWNAVVYAKDMPFGYYPYISFPAPGKPSTGLLMPQGGYSNRKGGVCHPAVFLVHRRAVGCHGLPRVHERTGLETGGGIPVFPDPGSQGCGHVRLFSRREGRRRHQQAKPGLRLQGPQRRHPAAEP